MAAMKKLSSKDDLEGDRKKALQAALAQIERDFGKGSIMHMGEDGIKLETPVISTGSLGLDIALGIGGLPTGRVIEIFGQESSGKTTLALHVIAEAQKNGGVCAFVDAEHALDLSYAGNLGITINDLLVSQPDSGEQALEIAETLVRSKAVDVLVVDSVAALTPQAEIEGEMIDTTIGLQARLMSKALRKLTGAISRSNCMVIFVNQTRVKIGAGYGKFQVEVTSGGNALKFYASVRLEIRAGAHIKSGEDTIGRLTKVKVVKNKLAPPFKSVAFDLIYGEGIAKTGELIDLGVKTGIIDKAGSWYSREDQRLGQGREAAKQFLHDNPDIAAKIEHDVRQSSGLSVSDASEPTPDGKEDNYSY